MVDRCKDLGDDELKEQPVESASDSNPNECGEVEETAYVDNLIRQVFGKDLPKLRRLFY